MRAHVLALATLVLAGCLSAIEQEEAAAQRPLASPPPPSHVLAGTVESTELVAPTFRLLGAVAKGGPYYGAGEPSIWAGLDGSVFLAFAGCDNGPYYFAQIPGSAPCGHGPV